MKIHFAVWNRGNLLCFGLFLFLFSNSTWATKPKGTAKSDEPPSTPVRAVPASIVPVSEAPVHVVKEKFESPTPELSAPIVTPIGQRIAKHRSAGDPYVTGVCFGLGTLLQSPLSSLGESPVTTGLLSRQFEFTSPTVMTRMKRSRAEAEKGLDSVHIAPPIATDGIYSPNYYNQWLARVLGVHVSEVSDYSQYLSSGAASVVYLIHEKLPSSERIQGEMDEYISFQGISKRDLIMRYPGKGEDERRKQFWVEGHSLDVVKLRRPVVELDMTSDELMKRDLSLFVWLDEVSSRFLFKNSKGVTKRLVKVAAYRQTEKELSEGILRQMPVFGPDAFTIGKIIRNSASDATEERKLKAFGFENILDAREHISALQEFYRSTEPDVKDSLRARKLPLIGNITRGGSIREMGYDYNCGRNAIWNIQDQAFYIIDP